MSQATLNGQLVNDGGQTCTVHFEWGTSTDYGFETPWQGGFTSGMTFAATIYNLAEGVLYHFRAVAKNSVTISYGNDMVFALPMGSTIPVMLDDAGLAQLLEVLK
jgi:hypothetical protein